MSVGRNPIQLGPGDHPKDLLCQFIQLNIFMSRDVMGYMIHNIPVAPPGLDSVLLVQGDYQK